MPDRSFRKEIVPNIQSEPPLMQLEAIASRPVAGYLGEETNPCFITTSCQVVVESDKRSVRRVKSGCNCIVSFFCQKHLPFKVS